MSQPTFQSLFYSPQFLPRLCSFTFLFSSFAAGLETHWNYSEFSKCLHGCLGCFLGYSIPTEFYSHSTWWLGGCWQQVLVVTDRVALDDFAVFHSAKTQSSQNTDFSPWYPVKFPTLAIVISTGHSLFPRQKTTEMGYLGRMPAWVQYVFWSEPATSLDFVETLQSRV